MDDHTPPKQSGTSLTQLGPDLLHMIIDLLPVADIKSLRLSNSYFTHSTRYGLHREIKLQFYGDDFSQTQARFSTLQAEGLLPAVRRLEVEGMCHDVRDYLEMQSSQQTDGDQHVRLVCWCLSQMPGLKDFLFMGPSVPAEVLTTLRTRPEVRFSMSAVGLTALEQLLALKHNQQLYSLEVQHTYVTAVECLLVTKPLREILLTCPNIRKLKLDIGMPTGGCVLFPIPTEYHGMGFRNGERPPPLEELEIVDYPFGNTSPSQFVHFQGYPEKIDEREYWAEVFDWSRLQKLRAAQLGYKFATELLPKLRALEELSLDHTMWISESTNQTPIEVTAGLKCLEVDSTLNLSMESVMANGTSLQRLKVHKQEQFLESWNNYIVQDSMLLTFRQHCPNLSTLALDVGRDGKWPYDTLDILASFSRLRTLELWFEVGVKDPKDPVLPYVTFAAAAKLFRYLHAKNPRIKRLTVHSGALPDIGFGYPSADAYWPEHNIATFECHLAAMEEEASQGIFTTICTMGGKEENNVLRRMLARYPQGNVSVEDAMETIGEDWNAMQDAMKRVCKVAWEGPVASVLFDFDWFAADAPLPLPDDIDT